MQIVPFPAYYQSVYTNFDFTSFSLISWFLKGRQLDSKRASFASQLGIFKKPKEHVLVLSGIKIVYKHLYYRNQVICRKQIDIVSNRFYLLAYHSLQDHLIWHSNTLHADKFFLYYHSIHLTT